MKNAMRIFLVTASILTLFLAGTDSVDATPASTDAEPMTNCQWGFAYCPGGASYDYSNGSSCQWECLTPYWSLAEALNACNANCGPQCVNAGYQGYCEN